MATLIENPIINSPYEEPTRHFVFDENGITNEIADSRRRSSYFIPIPPPRKKSAQGSFAAEWNAERIQENAFINNVRQRVTQWREEGSVGVTSLTRDLLSYWRNPDRERRLFFCQIQALETAIYLTEVAPRTGQAWIENDLRQTNEVHNPGLHRTAIKMATGSGKTVVMAMIIAWQTLNKLSNPQDARFSDTFLVVTPGITIRDRLRVLLPNDVNNFYEGLDLVTPEQLVELQRATVLITNFHQFLLKEKIDAVPLTKKLLSGPEGDVNKFRETPAEMVNRVCGGLAGRRNIVVINDEAHHCYFLKPESDEEKLAAEASWFLIPLAAGVPPRLSLSNGDGDGSRSTRVGSLLR